MQNTSKVKAKPLTRTDHRARTPKVAASMTAECCKPAAAQPVCVPRSVDPALRQQQIAQAAYFSAERRGFSKGGEMRDWLRAEKEIDSVFEGSHFCGD